MKTEAKEAIRYNPIPVEAKWSQIWAENKTFKVDIQAAKKPYYNLMMFPYPSGEGLHVGHTYAFGGADTFGRFKRMLGFDVFEPMGFDAFGIHSENYAIKKKIHPQQLIEQTTSYFRDKQLKRFGAIFDWDNSLSTTDPNYYRWTQWLFIQLFKAGLVERKKSKVDWCPSCLTVLADEQVIAGQCERCGSQVIKKDLEQWFFRITEYAERLLSGLDTIDWSETTKQMQKNWIGKSEGALVKFEILNKKIRATSSETRTPTSDLRSPKYIEIYTTRIDTIFGVSFVAIAPENPALFSENIFDIEKVDKDIVKENFKEAKDYINKAVKKTDQARMAVKAKTGVFTGSYAINPVNGQEVPVYIADFVLSSYGTGAVMGVPGHDERDYDFAKENNLDILKVVSDIDEIKKAERKIEPSYNKNRTELTEAFTGYGVLVNSGNYNNLSSKEAMETITRDLEAKSLAAHKTNYHLRDWLISRQRYWGPPIPMIYCQACAGSNVGWFDTAEFRERSKKQEARSKVQNLRPPTSDLRVPKMPGWFPIPNSSLPVELPFIENYQPRGSGKSPLESDPNFFKVACPNCGEEARRETDVSDTFLDSSWYFLRYPNVEISRQQQSKGNKLDKPWGEQILKKWLPVDMYIGGNEHAVLHLLYTRFVTMALHDLGYLEFEEPFQKFRAHGLVTYKGSKMSKSRGNVINPNDYFDSFGVDATKLYLLFIGPYEEGGDWNDRGIVGLYRFLQRIWALSNRTDLTEMDKKAETKLNQVIAKMTDNLQGLRFNTAISTLMGYSNYLAKKGFSKRELEVLLILLAPLAPFATEEAWQKLHAYKQFENSNSVHNQPWPGLSDQTQDDEVTVVIQINGKFVARLSLSQEKANDASAVNQFSLANQAVKSKLTTQPQKVIFIPGKIINFVTR